MDVSKYQKRGIKRLTKPGYKYLAAGMGLLTAAITGLYSLYSDARPAQASQISPPAIHETVPVPKSIDDTVEPAPAKEEYQYPYVNDHYKTINSEGLRQAVVDYSFSLIRTTVKKKKLVAIVDETTGKKHREWREVDVPNPKRKELETFLSGLTKYNDFINEASQTYNNVNSNLMRAQIIVESAVDPSKKSRAGAAGLAQFMERTAKRIGIKMNKYVDMRHDPKEAIFGEAELLSQLMKKYDGNAILALADYNNGPRRFANAIQGRNMKEIKYEDIQDTLHDETKDYIARVLAVKAILDGYYAENEEAKIALSVRQMPLFSESVSVYHARRGDSLAKIAKANRVSVKDLEKLNPHFRSFNVIPPRAMVYVPKNPVIN